MTEIHDHAVDQSVEHEDARPRDPVGRVLYVIARWIAVAGGIVLFAMGLMTTWSIIGRALGKIRALDEMGFGPVLGDWELMQVGTAVVACCFLPYTQIVRGNVIVDFFMNNAPPRFKATCDFFGSLMFLAVGTLITWRLYFGGLDMYSYHQRLTTINFEHWWSFPIIVPLMGFLVIVVIYTLMRDILNIVRGRGPGGRLSDH